ncbi:MAG: hypothetical protein FJW99_08290 [Actinobacteria bacterium]|nr:hypothetical protein [Actinomycetota bacterium]MBM3697307.1 hypothetical protein [Actinomycetota bacterium]
MSLAPGRLLSWSLSAILIGWVVIYNAMRVAGGTPAGVALTSFIIGAIAGLAVMGIGIWVRGRLIASGRIHPVDPEMEIPGPAQMNPGQKQLLGIAWPAVAVAAGVQIVEAVLLFVDWRGTPAEIRATAQLIMAVWFIFAGMWMAWEANNLRDFDAGGLDSVALGALLSTVLAGVAVSRDFSITISFITVIAAGVATVVAYYGVHRLARDRGTPWMTITAGVIVLSSLIIPIVTR